MDYRPPARQTRSRRGGLAATADRSIPPAFLAQTAVPLAALRRAPRMPLSTSCSRPRLALGMPFLAARFPRSFVDANREPYELDPGMFEGPCRGR